MSGAALLADLQSLLDAAAGRADLRVVCEVQAAGRRLPVPVLALGNPSPDVPAVGFFGGVHGLERIGAEVVIAYLRHVLQRLAWDELLHTQLQRLRMVFMPIVNPGGLLLGTRANPRGVDLMRNSPVESPHVLPTMLGGQRLSARLPWYRGEANAPMEAESRALCEVVSTELLSHCIQPQSHQYLTHGDLWDHLYQQSLLHAGRTFLPLTLEMGSWLWVRKNPRQFLSRHGLFNPLIQHRQERVLRRHIGALDFVARAAMSHARWRPPASQRDVYRERALDRWYRARAR
jgi:hypothetical protein